jgi:hypothetical protein
VWGTPPRQGTRGRLPKPRRYPPPDLCYAVVVKERAHGRVIHVTTRIVYGTTEQIEAALQASPGSYTINTYGVERNNLTVRQHARRMGRKVKPSKAQNYLSPNSPSRLRTTILLSHTAVCDNAIPPYPHQRPQRIAQEVEACDPSHGCWFDRSCLDNG